MTDEQSLLQFPCDFNIKVFGNYSNDFETTILNIIRKHIPSLPQEAIRMRPSKDGKYIALTIALLVESKTQLDGIYVDLTACPLVLMAL